MLRNPLYLTAIANATSVETLLRAAIDDLFAHMLAGVAEERVASLEHEVQTLAADLGRALRYAGHGQTARRLTLSHLYLSELLRDMRKWRRERPRLTLVADNCGRRSAPVPRPRQHPDRRASPARAALVAEARKRGRAA